MGNPVNKFCYKFYHIYILQKLKKNVMKYIIKSELIFQVTKISATLKKPQTQIFTPRALFWLIVLLSSYLLNPKQIILHTTVHSIFSKTNSLHTPNNMTASCHKTILIPTFVGDFNQIKLAKTEFLCECVVL